jgi:hypothetical protein
VTDIAALHEIERRSKLYSGGTFLLFGQSGERRNESEFDPNWRTETWSYKCLQERITPAPRIPRPGVFSQIHFASAGALAEVRRNRRSLDKWSRDAVLEEKVYIGSPTAQEGLVSNF